MAASQIDIKHLKLEILSGGSYNGNHAEVLKQMDQIEKYQNGQ